MEWYGKGKLTLEERDILNGYAGDQHLLLQIWMLGALRELIAQVKALRAQLKESAEAIMMRQ